MAHNSSETDVLHHINGLVKARVAVIGIQSAEEERVIRTLGSVAEGNEKAIVIWSLTRGLHSIRAVPGGREEIQQIDPVQDPFMMLSKLHQRDDNGGKAIYVIKDLHPFMKDPGICRALRDLARSFLVARRTLILVSPTLAVPPDLEKDIHVIDFPLPDETTLARTIEMAEKHVEGVPITLTERGRDQLIKALLGLTEVEARRLLRLAITNHRELGDRAIELVISSKADIVKKVPGLTFIPPTVHAEDIGDLDELKTYLRQREDTDSPEARAYGIEPDKGILLLGIPGTGKSLTAKAVGGGKRPILRLSVADLMGSLLGQSEGNLRAALQIADALKCVIWLDEIEKALSGGGGEHDGGTSTRMLGSLLTWMQEQSGCFVVATANDVRRLPPELLRRFNNIFFVDAPGHEGRVEILRIHLAKRRRHPQDFDLDAIAAATHDYTGAELEKIVTEALIMAWSDSRRPMTTDDLLYSASKIVPIARTMERQINEIRDWAALRARPASSRSRRDDRATGRSAHEFADLN